MASDIDLCNVALSHLGSDTVISDIDPPDGSVEAGHCARFYPIARRLAIEMAKPSWARTRVELAEVETNPSEIWTYAYQVPSDCVSALRVIQKASVAELPDWTYSRRVVTADEYQWFTERGSSDFTIENGVLLTHEAEAVLLYIRDITDAATFGYEFFDALSYILAGYLAGPIIKGAEGADAGRKFRQVGFDMLKSAAAGDANEASERNTHTPEHIRRR